MFFRWIALLAFALAAGASPSLAEPFSQMANKCSTTKYADVEYTMAIAEGTKASKAAKKAKDTRKATEIDLAVKQLKSCQKEEKLKFDLPPYKDCANFVADAKAYASWADAASKGKFATDVQIARLKQQFKPLADQCLKDLMSKCVDPTDTKAVMSAVEAVETAAIYTTVYSRAKANGFERAAIEYNPLNMNLKFCEDTNYACKGDPKLCSSRVPRIKAAFEAYIQR